MKAFVQKGHTYTVAFWADFYFLQDRATFWQTGLF